MQLLAFNLSRNQAKCKIKKEKKIVFLLKMPLGKGSAAMGFEIKEIKRQCRAVKVTHPPAERRQLHKRSGFTSAMKQQRNETTSQARLPGIGEDVKKNFVFE